MFKAQPLGALRFAAALVFLAGCGSGAGTSHAASLPESGSVVRPNDRANRVVSSRAQHYVAQLGVARDRTVEQNISDAASRGARVFRVPTYIVWDPSTSSTYAVSKSEIHETAQGIAVDTATGRKLLSRDAKVNPNPRYGYMFVRGSESDPDPSTGAIRVK
jgi:hypothetical protein